MTTTATAKITIETLTASALGDAATMPEGATIYIDPNVGGLAYSFHTEDDIESGPIGHEAADYGDKSDGCTNDDYNWSISMVLQSLRDAGYDVA